MKILQTYLMSLPYVGTGPSQNNKAGLLAVLTEDSAGSQAVYIAVVPDNLHPDRRAEFADIVAGRGAKQTFRDAAYFFKGLDETLYRR